MADDRLRQDLIAFGLSPGPITDGTRSLYQKKLEKLRSENLPSSSTKTKHTRAARASSAANASFSGFPNRTSPKKRTAATSSSAKKLVRPSRKLLNNSAADFLDEKASNTSESDEDQDEFKDSPVFKTPALPPPRRTVSAEKPYSAPKRTSRSSFIATPLQHDTRSSAAKKTSNLVDFSDQDSDREMRGSVKSRKISATTSSSSKSADRLSTLLNKLSPSTSALYQKALNVRTRVPRRSMSADDSYIDSVYSAMDYISNSSTAIAVVIVIVAILAFFLVSYSATVIKAVSAATAQTASVVMHNIVVPFALLAALIGLFYVGWLFKKRRDEEQLSHDREKQQLANQVLDLMQEHHEKCQSQGIDDTSLAIPHVRDMLIPSGQRAAKRALWNSVVEFLREHDSRLRIESKLISGDDCSVWRWIPLPNYGGPASAAGSPADVKWQGSALSPYAKERVMTSSSKSVARSPASPQAISSCLKIRQLFDENFKQKHGASWPKVVERTVLQRVGETGDVVHMAVDTHARDGCVYMRCLTKDAAGYVFRALHGSWLNGNLITVKYLRDEHYAAKFPECVGAATPLNLE